MNIINEFFVCLITTILSYIVFSIIFYGLNKSMLMLFVPIQNITAKIKRKSLIMIISKSIILVLCISIKTKLNLNYATFGVMNGFFNSLINTLFSKGIMPYNN